MQKKSSFLSLGSPSRSGSDLFPFWFVSCLLLLFRMRPGKDSLLFICTSLIQSFEDFCGKIVDVGNVFCLIFT